MKLLLITCPLVLCNWVNAQYLPTIEENKTWAVSGYDIVNFGWRHMTEIYIDGEEVYEGQEYKVLRINSELASEHPFGLIREDTLVGKVWFRAYYHGDFDEYIDTSEEVMLADYSLEAGNQFYYTYFRGYWEDDFFIDSLLFEVEEVGIISGRKYIQTNSLTVLNEEQNGLWGDPFYYSDLQYPVASQVPLRFIEGIGSSFSLISQNLFTLNSFSVVDAAYPFDPYLLCAYVDDVEIWNDPFVEGCHYEGDLPLITNVENHNYDFDFVAFPNPAKDMIYLKSDPMPCGAELELFDIHGRQHSTTAINPGAATYVLPMGHLPAGMYVLRCVTGGEVVWSGKVLKQ